MHTNTHDAQDSSQVKTAQHLNITNAVLTCTLKSLDGFPHRTQHLHLSSFPCICHSIWPTANSSFAFRFGSTFRIWFLNVRLQTTASWIHLKTEHGAWLLLVGRNGKTHLQKIMKTGEWGDQSQGRWQPCSCQGHPSPWDWASGSSQAAGLRLKRREVQFSYLWGVFKAREFCLWVKTRSQGRHDRGGDWEGR